MLAAVVESADTRDLKSLGGNSVSVQVRSAAPKIPFTKVSGIFICCKLKRRSNCFSFYFYAMNVPMRFAAKTTRTKAMG